MRLWFFAPGAKRETFAMSRRCAAPLLAALLLALRAGIAGVGKTPLPRLRQLEIALNRVVRIDSSGLPVCRLAQVQPASTEDARAACGGSLVGSGRFSASVQIPETVHYPTRGRVDAFNGRYRGARRSSSTSTAATRSPARSPPADDQP